MADINKIKNILAKSKAIMKTVDSDNYSTGNIDESMLMGQQPMNQQTMVEPTTPNMDSSLKYSNDAIMNSNLPKNIKEAMIQHKIDTPDMHNSFSLEGLEDLIEKPMPNLTQQPRKRKVNENTVTNQGISKSELRETIKEVLIEYLTKDYNKNITENVIKKTINTLIKEGKIRTKK